VRAISVGSVVLLALLLWLLVGEPRDGGPDGTAPSAGSGAGGAEATARVSRVVDGDTIEVDLGGAEEDVRYIGIDTPETVKPGTPVQCFGPEASARNHELVENQRVRLVFDAERRDVYGRLLAYVYVGDEFVNGELVAGGYARTLEIEPNTSMAGRLGHLEEEAGAAGRGLWGAC
jgi:micrococcal nuclease